MNRTAVTTLLCGFATVGLLSGTASAATTAERAYLKALDDTYQTAYKEDAKSGTGKDADALIKAGQRSCAYIKDQVAKGIYSAETADKALKWDPEVYVTEGETTLIRQAALDNLCPNVVKGGTVDAPGTTGAKGDGDKSTQGTTSDTSAQSDRGSADKDSAGKQDASGTASTADKKDSDSKSSTSGKQDTEGKSSAPKKDQTAVQDGPSGKTDPKKPAGGGGLFGTGSAGN
ncbi:hypothetical protein [Nocardia alni]|uniref:hypothetical protein n=1 Tax=Nocardia alni TaxID=2815723 RepID=UPI001C22644B|nr:hypothetical protein [Nocardia alni]